MADAIGLCAELPPLGSVKNKPQKSTIYFLGLSKLPVEENKKVDCLRAPAVSDKLTTTNWERHSAFCIQIHSMF